MNTEKPEFILKLESYGIKVLLPPESIVYKYVSFETAVKIIKSNSFLFSKPTTFNDPFDLTNALIDKNVTPELFNSWLDSHNLDAEKKNAILKSVEKDEKYISKMLNQTLEQYKNITGITCFSKSYKKTLMWSHYADKHAGICLGFNILPIRENGNFTLLEVNYADKIIPMSFFIDRPFPFMRWLYTKSKVWEYEEEVRAVYMDKNGFIPFESNCLKEVHFGLKTTESQREEFLKLLKELNYKIDRASCMSMDSETFDLKENDMASS